MKAYAPQRLYECRCVFTRSCLKSSDIFAEGVLMLCFVVDAETTAGVHVPDAMSLALQLADQPPYALHGCAKGSGLGDLRPDVDAHARRLQMLLARSQGVEPARVSDSNAELMFPKTGRDIRVGLGGNIGVHTESDPCGLLQPRGGGCQ